MLHIKEAIVDQAKDERADWFAWIYLKMKNMLQEKIHTFNILTIVTLVNARRSVHRS